MPEYLSDISIIMVLGWIVLGFFGYSLIKSEITGNWNWSMSQFFDFNLDQDK